MRPRILIQGWLPGGPALDMPSGARNRLLGLVRGVAHDRRASQFHVELLVSRSDAPDLELIDATRRLPHGSVREAPIASRPAWRRILAERTRVRNLVRDADLVELASLPVPPSGANCNLVVHDLRDLGTFARGMLGSRRLVAVRSLEVATRHVTRFVVPSRTVAEQLVAEIAVSRDRVCVVPPGLRAPPRASWPNVDRLPARAFVSLARPEPRKDLSFALRAWSAAKRVNDALPDLVFAGPRDRRWRTLVCLAQELGHGGHVHFVHDLSDAERWPLLARASALVFPSRLEGFGLPALEAALVGCPALVRTDSPAHRELASHVTALGDHVEEWSTAILERVAASSRSESPRDVRGFTPENAASAWLDSWESSLEGRKPSATQAAELS